MHVDLLGYLLGALDACERQQVEAELRRNPALVEELRRLVDSLEPLSLLGEDVAPPPGLAERTCSRVFEEPRPKLPAMSSANEPVAAPARWTKLDAIAAVCALGALLMVLVPALATSRFRARLASCQNRLAQLGQALIGFSDMQPNRSFPRMASSGNRSFSGVVIPILRSRQWLPKTTEVVLCPAAELSADLSELPPVMLEEIDQANPAMLRQLQARAGGTYGYQLGYAENGQLFVPRNLSRTYYPLISDAPRFRLDGTLLGTHGMSGMNFLFEDGHTEFIREGFGAFLQDDPLHNRLGCLTAGLDANDGVIVVAGQPPLTPPAPQGPSITAPIITISR